MAGRLESLNLVLLPFGFYNGEGLVWFYVECVVGSSGADFLRNICDDAVNSEAV